MLRLRNLILYSLPLAATLVLSQSEPQPSTEINAAADQSFDFQELLNAIPEESIHAALHQHLDAKYQDGVYEHDRSAVEAVRKEDPPTATKLLVGAALHLIKRQNGTAVATTATTTSSTTPAAVIVPVTQTTTDSAGKTTVISTSAVATASVSVTVPVTTTNAAGSTVVSSKTVAAAVVTASNGQATTSAVPTFNAVTTVPTSKVDVTTTDKSGATVVLSSVTPGQVIKTTDARGSTFITTYTPGGGKISSLVLHTTTLPNGQQSVVTSYANVQLMTETAGASASSTATATPKLQNGAESFRCRGLGAAAIALVGGAISVALFL